MSNLPAPVERRLPAPHPSLVRAAVSPTAVAATAIGAGIGLLAQSIPLAVALAVMGWTIRMIVAFIVQRRRERAAVPHPAQLDPWSVPDPWRSLVQQAAAAQTRFEQVIGEWPDGPLRDRVRSLRATFYGEFEAVGAIAKRGAATGGWTGAAPTPGRLPTAESLAPELERTRAERVGLGDRAPGRAEELSRREEAIAAQLHAVHTARQAAESVHDRLRLVVSRLDEAVTHLLTLSIEAGDGGGLDRVTEVMTSLADELGALEAGLAETRTPPDALTP